MGRNGSGQPRLLIYSQDGLGLGHQRRTSAIAAECCRRRPGVSILTIADSPLGAVFETQPGHDYVKLPSIRKLGPGQWEAVSLQLGFAQVATLRRGLIQETVLGFAPDVLLVDHMPHGAMGELVGTLDALRRYGRPTQIVLGLRDIIDDPQTVRSSWRAEGAYDALVGFYDRVLVYGERRLFDLASAYRFPPAVIERTRHCGYVCTPDRARYAGRVRARYRGTDRARRLVVAMAGGGADGYPLLRALLDALPAVQAEQPIAVILVTGPFMPVTERRDLQARAAVCGATARISVSDSLSYIEAADLVVAMAGYNTAVEILRAGVPAVLVPRDGPSAEQRMRAARFAEQGWVDVLDPRRLDPETVAGAVLAGLAREDQAQGQGRTADLSGLDQACSELLELLDAPGLVGRGPSPGTHGCSP
ncbi:MAG: glycosyltransferase family protein [Egibacteraceae bacterium]